jgi:DNA-binding CsgD family transcriptional regulator
MRLPEAVVADRDARVFEMRKAGISYRKIAAALDISESTAHAAMQRVMKRVIDKQSEQYQEALQLELERLDHLLQNIWPMTMPQVIQDEDGREMRLPPSLEAIDRALKISDRRAKLLGLDNVTVGLKTDGGSGIELGSNPEIGQVTPKEEALRLLRVMSEAGVLDKSMMATVQSQFGDIVDAEVVEDSEPPALPPGEDLDE